MIEKVYRRHPSACKIFLKLLSDLTRFTYYYKHKICGEVVPLCSSIQWLGSDSSKFIAIVELYTSWVFPARYVTLFVAFLSGLNNLSNNFMANKSRYEIKSMCICNILLYYLYFFLIRNPTDSSQPCLGVAYCIALIINN